MCDTIPVGPATTNVAAACLLVLGAMVSDLRASAAPDAEPAAYRVVRSFVLAPEPSCMPASTRAHNGDLIVAWSTQWEPFPGNGVLHVTRSSDEGRTWTEPQVVWRDADPEVAIHVSNGLTTLDDGTILLPVARCRVPRNPRASSTERLPSRLYVLGAHDPDRVGVIHVLRSRDHGKTWSGPRPLPLPEGYLWTQRFGRLARAANDDLLVSMYGATAERRFTGFYRSRDGGSTWEEPEEILYPFQSETLIVPMGNGELMAVLRPNRVPDWPYPRRTFGVAFSGDHGRTFTDPKPMHIQGKMPDALVLPGGRILLAVGAEGLADGSDAIGSTRPSFVTIFMSDDHGRSWRRALEAGTPGGTPTHVAADGPVLCPLSGGRILLVCQGIDYAKRGHPLFSYSVGMAVVGNVIEPVPATIPKSGGK